MSCTEQLAEALLELETNSAAYESLLAWRSGDVAPSFRCVPLISITPLVSVHALWRGWFTGLHCKAKVLG